MDNQKLINIINDDEENKDKTLEQLNFHIYILEIKKSNEEFNLLILMILLLML
jgi:hypothetical protein